MVRGFGRLGDVGGPMFGGLLIGAGFALDSIFYVLAALGALGVVLTLLVPVDRVPQATHATREPKGDAIPAGKSKQPSPAQP